MSLQQMNDEIVLDDIAQEALEIVPPGDKEAATSAFFSEVAPSEYAYYFPWLEPGT